MKIIIRLAFLVASLAGGAHAADVVDQFGQRIPEQLDTLVTQARKQRLPYLENFYNIDQSIATLEQVVNEKGDYFRAWFNLGLAYWQASGDSRSRYSQAKEAFDKAIAIRDAEKISDISVFNSAGWVSMRAGDHRSAEHYFLRGLEDIEQGSDYTKEALYSNLGRVYFYTQRFDKAIEFSRIAVDRFGNDDSAAETLTLVRKTMDLAAIREASLPPWGVVFGADTTQKLALHETNTFSKNHGIEDVRIYLRAGSYRSVAEADSESQAQELLKAAKKHRADAYMVRMFDWCPKATERSDILVECIQAHEN
ncbi:MAG: tetratricopeptide repeat protein [Gammaproteobacteria bacterium]|jgi:tetratricopeptide (TPR) repeat protein|nr:tetratricopeptide repeat protein [Gammaproteobacteria bacterium]